MLRPGPGGIEVLLVHPGGPFWKRRDEGAWSIPKGEIEPGEEPIDVARREFQEELGLPAPDGDVTPLGSVKQAGGKVVHAWAVRSDVDVSRVRSVMFDLEWPPRSGEKVAFPEVDRAEWFALPAARHKVVRGQVPILDTLAERLGE